MPITKYNSPHATNIALQVVCLEHRKKTRVRNCESDERKHVIRASEHKSKALMITATKKPLIASMYGQTRKNIYILSNWLLFNFVANTKPFGASTLPFDVKPLFSLRACVSFIKSLLISTVQGGHTLPLSSSIRCSELCSSDSFVPTASLGKLTSHSKFGGPHVKTDHGSQLFEQMRRAPFSSRD